MSAPQMTPAEKAKLDSFRKELGVRLRMIRAQLGWTQRDLGSVLGFSRQAVNSFESGSTEPPASSLSRLKEHGIDLAWVMGECGALEMLKVSPGGVS